MPREMQLAGEIEEGAEVVLYAKRTPTCWERIEVSLGRLLWAGLLFGAGWVVHWLQTAG